VADLPKLQTITYEPRAFARVLRSALKNEVVMLPLARAPTASGPHLLHVVLQAETKKAVWILAEPTTAGLKLSPRSDVQAAQLYALAQLGGPTSEPPPEYIGGPTIHSSQAPVYSSDMPTIVDEGVPRTARLPADLVPIAPPSPRIDPMIGRIVGGRYRIEALLGRGTAGAVYRGVHTELGRDVAIKILHSTNRGDHQFVKRFEAEARAASRIEHAHVTRVLDFGEESDGTLFLVMEYLAGRTLESVIGPGVRLDAARAIDIAIQVSSALSRAHAEGIIHRDIKPENIMLLRQVDDDDQEPIEMVKVCDFGVAKWVTPENAMQSELTIGGGLLGSPLYMAPEQIRSEKLDPRCDVYSLGVMLYEITVGHPPFDAETIERILAMHLFEAPARPSTRVPDYDPALEAIVMKTLAKKADDRPTARALRTQLRDLVMSRDPRVFRS
jgi:eukaryotic-like serine/threonine-protein kinase